MPIVKVPVEHRFGVVSLNRAEELLQKQKEKVPTKSTKKDSASILTVAFIRKYNNCRETDRVSLDAIIRRTLEHAKYKAGLNSTKHATAQSDDKTHMSIAEGWIELTMICQCGGMHQEEALLALSASLSLSSPSPCHLPALFYVAGLCLQWLKSDVTSGSVLRSAELLLLKILYKVSLRLYFHYIQDSMEEHPREMILQLKFDMDGFENKQSLYQHFPEALLHWRVSLEVGNLVCTQNSGTCTFSSPAQTTLTTLTEHQDTTSTATSHSLTPILWHALDVWQCVQLGSPLLNEAIEDLVTCSINFATEQMLEGLLAMQFLCSAAELNLTVLSLLQSLAAGNAHQAFSKQSSPCSTPFSSKDHATPSEKEVYSSPTHPNTLNVLGMQPAFKQPSEEYSTAEEEDDEDYKLEDDEVEEKDEKEEEEDYSLSRDLTSLSVGTQGLIENETIPDLLGSDSSHSNLASHADLSAIDSFELSGFKDISATGLPPSLSQQTVRQGVSQKRVTLGSVVDMGEETIEENVESDVASRSSVDSSFDRVGLLDDRFEMFGVLKKKYKVAKSVTLTLPPRNVDSRCTHYTHSTAPLSGGMVVMGSQVPPSTVYRQSLLSSYHTIGTDRTGLSSSVAPNHVHRFDTWPVEASVVYTISMASIIIYGRSSHIQKLALEGGSYNSYALKQLSSYDGNKFLSNTSINNPSWIIRHCALIGLSRVAQICKKQTAKDGFSSVAWSKLVERQSVETDQRVLEAHKLQQASPNDEDLMLQLKCNDHIQSFPLISLMADSLAQMYLPTPSDPTPPPLPPPPATRKSPSKPAVKTTIVAIKKRPVSVNKQSGLRDETTGPNNKQLGLCARADQTLRSIAEKHWRLQMEKEDAEELTSS